MSATIFTSEGDFTGRSIESIVRRVWGKKAYVLESKDGSSPQFGNVVRESGQYGWAVLSVVYAVEGPLSMANPKKFSS